VPFEVHPMSWLLAITKIFSGATVVAVVVGAMCRHRIVVEKSTSSATSAARQHRIRIENVEGVALKYPLQIALKLSDPGNFVGQPVLLCGHREYATVDDGSNIEDSFSADKKSFYFVVPYLPPYASWTIVCESTGPSDVSMAIFGYDPQSKKRTTYFPVVPTEKVAVLGKKSQLKAKPTPPFEAFIVVAAVAASIYTISWWHPHVFAPTSPTPTLAPTTDVSWSLVLLLILILMIVVCFVAVRLQPQAITHGNFRMERNITVTTTPDPNISTSPEV
jgi:hypothetical protein